MPEVSQVVMSFGPSPTYVGFNVQGPLSNEDLGLIWLDWVKRLNSAMLSRYDLVLLVPKKTYIEDAVLAPWRSVKRYDDNQGIIGWPRGPNLVFQQIQWFQYHDKFKGAFLWCEPDCVPVVDNWLDLIAAEYAQSKKPFLGALVERQVVQGQAIPRHMTGNAVYPNKAYTEAGRLMEAVTTAWDVFAADQIIPKTYFTKLIQHEYRHAEIKTMGELRALLKPETALFHSDKYGAIPKLLSGPAASSEVEKTHMEPEPAVTRDDIRPPRYEGLDGYELRELLIHLTFRANESPDDREQLITFARGFLRQNERQQATEAFERIMNESSSDALATLNG